MTEKMESIIIYNMMKMILRGLVFLNMPPGPNKDDNFFATEEALKCVLALHRLQSFMA